MVQQLKVDLKAYIQSSVADGTMGVRGNFVRVSNLTSTGSAAVPVLSHQTYNSVSRRSTGRRHLAKTHKPNQFDGGLSQMSRKVPFGHDQLFRPGRGMSRSTTPPSRLGPADGQEIKADLDDYVVSAIADETSDTAEPSIIRKDVHAGPHSFPCSAWECLPGRSRLRYLASIRGR